MLMGGLMKERVVNSENVLTYPKDHTLGFFDSDLDLDHFLDEVGRLGIDPQTVEVIEGEEGLNVIDSDGSQHGLVRKGIRLFQKFFDVGEWELMKLASQELKNGHILVAVGTQESQKEQVVELMKKFGSHDIKYFNAWYVEHFSSPRSH